jgi:hypothetical protein
LIEGKSTWGIPTVMALVSANTYTPAVKKQRLADTSAALLALRCAIKHEIGRQVLLSRDASIFLGDPTHQVVVRRGKRRAVVSIQQVTACRHYLAFGPFQAMSYRSRFYNS